MTNEQKSKILESHAGGLGYKRIAAELDIPLGTVKSACRRCDPTVELPPSKMPQPDACKNCGADIKPTFGHRPLQFCSDRCRVHFWRAQRRANKE